MVAVSGVLKRVPLRADVRGVLMIELEVLMVGHLGACVLVCGGALGGVREMDDRGQVKPDSESGTADLVVLGTEGSRRIGTLFDF